MDTYMTVAGNLTADPIAHFTANGATVVHLRVASSGRKFDKAAGEFRDTDPIFISVSCWRSIAHNVLLSLKKGDSVIVHGRLTYRSYEDKDGIRRNVHEIDATAIGPDLSRSSVEIKRPNKAGSDAPADAPAAAEVTTGVDREPSPSVAA
ncbi:MAG: single-stranded DNA-binding protein [Frankiaceae bacterium]|nr:single-stranded DNA-binding protein [Frankiaceae bacterium]MBV9870742.1 single-stranded DNA-binding protein [Frankiaceae bacterium]